MPLTIRVALLGVACCAVAQALQAQRPDSGTVHISVTESMGPVEGVLVRGAGSSAMTDASGNTRLILPVGRHTLSLARIGYQPSRVTVHVVPDSIVTVRVVMAMEGMPTMLEEVKVSATRIERLAGDVPIRVEVLDEMEVEENTLMAPSGITMLLNETPGIRVQQASPSLGTGSVRILGLPGQYTAMLADGLPLYGGSMSALGPLDISPVDLQRVEIIKGAASALYGGQALGGVINLVSKPPSGKNEALLNRRTLGVTDAATWLSRRIAPETGVSLLASGTLQSLWDIDDDGWADQSRARRWNLRPRLARVDARGRALFVTAGYGYDSRNGGTTADGRAPDGFPFAEGLTSRRADLGASAQVPTADSGNVSVRLALALNRRERRFGPDPVEQDRTTTGFLELTRTFMGRRNAAALGGAVQLDRFSNRLNGAHDHRWVTPSAFVTAEQEAGPITLSASLRADLHPEAGLQLTQRLAALTRPTEDWSIRVSAGTGFADVRCQRQPHRRTHVAGIDVAPQVRGAGRRDRRDRGDRPASRSRESGPPKGTKLRGHARCERGFRGRRAADHCLRIVHFQCDPADRRRGRLRGRHSEERGDDHPDCRCGSCRDLAVRIGRQVPGDVRVYPGKPARRRIGSPRARAAPAAAPRRY